MCWDRNGGVKGMGIDGGGTSASTPRLRRGCRRNAPASRLTEWSTLDWNRTTMIAIDTGSAGTENRLMCTAMWLGTSPGEVCIEM